VTVWIGSFSVAMICWERCHRAGIISRPKSFAINSRSSSNRDHLVYALSPGKQLSASVLGRLCAKVERP